MQRIKSTFIALTLVIFASGVTIFGQTSAFTYQGRLTDGAAAANGTFEMQFALYDDASEGVQIGETISNSAVSVTNGTFTVQLNFSAANAFDGSPRWLQIAVRKASDPPGFTILTPRQPLTSAPYAIRSLNAATAENALNLNNLPASSYVVTTDARLSDARTPTAGSEFYIRNGTDSQAAGNFNIDGTGAANVFNAATQYNIGGNRVLSINGSNNIYAGVNAGLQATGQANAVFGASAGAGLTSGGFNAFFGFRAGMVNTVGTANSFFGEASGMSNTIGGFNTFVGNGAGRSNVSGSENFFGGRNAGQSNVSGNRNVYLGLFAGGNMTTGDNNVFVGPFAGSILTSGTENTFVGNAAGGVTSAGVRNSFFGSRAGLYVTGNDNSFFGQSSGGNQSVQVSGESNSFFGATTGLLTTTGSFNSYFGRGAGANNQTGNKNAFFGRDAGLFWLGSFNTALGADAGILNQNGSNNTIVGFNAQLIGNPLNYASAIGSNARVSTDDTIVIGKAAGIYLDPATNTNVTRPADTVRIPGSAVVSGTLTTVSLTIGTNGTPLTRSLSATATLDFPSTAHNATSDLTITVEGAADGDAIFLGVRNSNIAPLAHYTAWVSSPGTVTVRFTNQTGADVDPAAGLFRVVVMR